MTKLSEEAKEKTVAIESFEGNNLVLVDEGHRGASGGEDGAWMKARNALCEKCFSFEYSATFQQAVSGKPKLIDLYAKSILFNYSYRYFYGDGFGKDYQILNLDEGTQKDHLVRKEMDRHYLGLRPTWPGCPVCPSAQSYQAIRFNRLDYACPYCLCLL